MKSEELFDKNVADKLSTINITDPASAWDQFMAHHNKTNLEKAFLFDQAVKGRVTPPVNIDTNGQWESFSNKFQYQSGIDAQLFDKQLRTKIAGDHLAVANSKGENTIPDFLLRHRRNTQLRIYKAMEVAAVLMVFFLAWYTIVPQSPNLNIGKISVEDNSQYSTSSLENPESTEPGQTRSSVENDNNLSHVEDNLTLESSSGQMGKSDNKLIALRNSRLNPTAKSARLIPFSEVKIENNIARLALEGMMLKSGSIEEVNPSNTGANPLHSIADEPIIALMNNSSSSYVTADRSGINRLESRVSDPASLFTIDNSWALLNTLNSSLSKKAGIISKIMLGFHVGPVIDKVTTPISNFAGKRNYSRGIYNNLAGINVEIENRWVNVETGINYSYKNYGVNQQEGSRGHFINIPLSLKKGMLVRKSIRPYVKLGPDINFVLSSNVKPEQVRRESLDLQYYAPSKNYVDKESVKGGILHGGKLSDNSYFGIHGAVGVEANLSSSVQISIEVSQQFNPFQNGLGINDQKFTQTAASIGLKKRIYENYY